MPLFVLACHESHQFSDEIKVDIEEVGMLD